MKWESIMQQLHEGLHILPPQYSRAEPRLATVDVDFACYKQKEMQLQIKGNFPFSHEQRTWHSTRSTALWLDIHGLPYIITNRPIKKIRNENNLLQIKGYIIRLSSWYVMIKKKLWYRNIWNFCQFCGWNVLRKVCFLESESVVSSVLLTWSNENQNKLW